MPASKKRDKDEKNDLPRRRITQQA